MKQKTLQQIIDKYFNEIVGATVLAVGLEQHL